LTVARAARTIRARVRRRGGRHRLRDTRRRTCRGLTPRPPSPIIRCLRRGPSRLGRCTLTT